MITCSWGFNSCTNCASGWRIPELLVWQGNASGGKRAEDAGPMALYFAATALRLVKQGPILPPRAPHPVSGSWQIITGISTMFDIFHKECLVYLIRLLSWIWWHCCKCSITNVVMLLALKDIFLWSCNHPWILLVECKLVDCSDSMFVKHIANVIFQLETKIWFSSIQTTVDAYFSVLHLRCLASTVIVNLFFLSLNQLQRNRMQGVPVLKVAVRNLWGLLLRQGCRS